MFSKIYSLLETNKPIITIGITGPYAAGKTNFCKEFSEYLISKNIHPIHLMLDSYFKHSRKDRHVILDKLNTKGVTDEEKGIVYALDEPLMMEHIDMLKQKKSIHAKGLYQRSTGTKDLELDINFEGIEKPICIMYDGIWVLHSPIREKMDSVIVFDADRKIRYHRALYRAQSQATPYDMPFDHFMELENIINPYLEKNKDSKNVFVDNNNFKNRIIE